MLACSTVENEFYGVPKIDLRNPIYKNKIIIIDIGAKGVRQLKKHIKI